VGSVRLTGAWPIRNVPGQLDDIDRERASSVYLFGFKRDAYVYIETHGPALWAKVKACPLADPGAAILALAAVPGLGVVKAGFAAQLMGWDVACLDGRNIEREGLSPRAYRSDGEARKSRPAFKRKVARYVAVILPNDHIHGLVTLGKGNT
jgi:hypothetical protein